VNIPYTYLAVLLVFTLLMGVVIGDRLAAGVGSDGDDGRTGSCAGLASARLHECLHRYGHLRTKKGGRSGTASWPDANSDASCELPEEVRDEP
jgi:hypothetical protein